ncbi:hypothetical protein TrCOL_g2718 [Triparma columacea]|uniref:Zinc transporter n=1 Tax=Triparma columacea TaxID=722753 RepID=A0A9W7GF88_9STRA|nr:hypothetical protein TrCOL_g2718 [Triparma columacea]
MSPEVTGFLLVLAAGLSTGVGSGFVFSNKLISLASRPFLAGSLGFSAGVMVYVSFAEILQKGVGAFETASEQYAIIYATLSFFLGVVFMVACDKAVHTLEHASYQRGGEAKLVMEEGKDGGCCEVKPAAVDEWVARANKELANEVNHESETEAFFCGKSKSNLTGLRSRGSPTRGDRNNGDDEEVAIEEASIQVATSPKGKVLGGGEGQSLKVSSHDRALVRMGLATALSIAIHNFPEGLATYIATVDDPAVGLTLAVAIAIHNIPEGLCVSIPIYYATGDRKKAFLWGLLSGITEPIGALFGWAVLSNSMSEVAYGIMFSAVAGMMVIITMKELIPTAHRYDSKDAVVTNAFIAGMGVMALSLCLFVV